MTAVNGGATVHMFWQGAPVSNSPNGRTLIWRGIGTTQWVPLDFPEIMGLATSTMQRFSLKLGASSRGRGLIELQPCRGGRWSASAQIRYRELGSESGAWGVAKDSIRCRNS